MKKEKKLEILFKICTVIGVILFIIQCYYGLKYNMAEESMKEFYNNKIILFYTIAVIDALPLFYLMLFYDEKKSALRKKRRTEARKNKEYSINFNKKWNIKIGKPNELDEIFTSKKLWKVEFKIASYSKNDIQKIIKNLPAKTVDKDKTEQAIENILSKKEKERYQNYIKKSITQDNYYTIIKKEKDFCILIIDRLENKIYILEVIYEIKS